MFAYCRLSPQVSQTGTRMSGALPDSLLQTAVIEKHSESRIYSGAKREKFLEILPSSINVHFTNL